MSKAYRDSHKEKISEYNKKYYAKNKAILKLKREMRDKVLLDARNKRYRLRYANDEEFREHKKAAQREYSKRKKAERIAKQQEDEQKRLTQVSGESC